jgi:hypothetical protein
MPLKKEIMVFCNVVSSMVLFFFLIFLFLKKSFFFNHQGGSDTRVGIMVWSLELALHAS